MKFQGYVPTDFVDIVIIILSKYELNVDHLGEKFSDGLDILNMPT
jgi:hypothetical protein